MEDEDKDRKVEANVKIENPDRGAAEQKPRDGEDRAGFDLGGASSEGRQGVHTTIPGGPKSSPSGGRGGGGAG